MLTENNSNEKKATAPTSRKLRVLIVVTLIILTVQGWFGDVVNIFLAPATGESASSFPFSLSGFLQGVYSLGFPLEYHAFEGMLLVALSIAVLALSFKWSGAKSVRICAIFAAFFVFSAALGGFLFVLSGFSDGGNSAQMGGSFIGSYAFNFIALYYAK